MKEVFSIVLVIIGALIGAGFASGQEIYSFFYSYGKIGVLGIVITCTLISLTIYKSLKIIYKNNIKNYDEFLKIYIKNKKVTKIINIILNILLLVTFYIMVAGFGAYFEQELGINRIYGSFILVVLSGIVFFTSVKGVLKVSEIIVPILILFIIIVGTINLVSIDVNVEIPNIKRGWILSSLSYCSYNIILIIPVLISLNNQIKQKESIKYISIIIGMLMIIMSVIIYMLLVRADINISVLEMPVVYVIRKFFAKFNGIYAFIILSSIFTTAISIGTGFLQNINKNRRSYPQFVLFMCITSLLITNFGFSRLVNIIYPIFGYIGIIQIIFILLQKD